MEDRNPEPGIAVPAYHPGCTGSLTLIQTYGKDIVACDACEEEFPVEKHNGVWYFKLGEA